MKIEGYILQVFADSIDIHGKILHVQLKAHSPGI
jgi:hypothetical protein